MSCCCTATPWRARGDGRREARLVRVAPADLSARAGWPGSRRSEVEALPRDESSLALPMFLPLLLTLTEAATYLEVSFSIIKNLIEGRQLPVDRREFDVWPRHERGVWRVPWEALRKYRKGSDVARV